MFVGVRKVHAHCDEKDKLADKGSLLLPQLQALKFIMLVLIMQTLYIYRLLACPTQAAKRRGVAFEVIEKKLTEIEVMLPGLVNLHRAKASDWVSLSRQSKA